jgi:hypothetical protein
MEVLLKFMSRSGKELSIKSGICGLWKEFKFAVIYILNETHSLIVSVVLNCLN